MSGNPTTCDTFASPAFIARALRRRRRDERVRRACALAGALLVLAALLAIPLYLLGALSPWTPLAPQAWLHFGVLFAGTLRAAACAIAVALPLGLAAAMFSAHYATPALRAWTKPALELLEAIPTVVLGLVATATLAPWLKLHVGTLLALFAFVPALLLALGMAFGRRVRREGWLPLWLVPVVVAAFVAVVAIGARSDAPATMPAIVPATPWNAMLVGLALGVATVPLVFSLAEDALFLVPRDHAQAAFALGATRWQALTTVLLPAAGSGLLAAATLGFSRCLGETMIVLMAGGNTPIGGFDPLAGVRSFGVELAVALPEASPQGEAWRGLLLAALFLLVLTLGLNALAEVVRARLRRRLRAGAAA